MINDSADFVCLINGFKTSASITLIHNIIKIFSGAKHLFRENERYLNEAGLRLLTSNMFCYLNRNTLHIPKYLKKYSLLRISENKCFLVEEVE